MSSNQYTRPRRIGDTLWCNFHKQYEPLESFYIHSYGYSYYCKEGTRENSRKNHNKRIKNDPSYKESKKNSYIKEEYGITLEEYRQKLVAQDNKCAICSIPIEIHTKYAHLDHDHTTGKLRDFLCGNCNRGIGSFHDEVWKMKKAIEYLERHK